MTETRESIKMNNPCRKVPTRFGPETRFEINPVPFRATLETAFEQLKERLLRERLAQAINADLNLQVRRAANEAAALAWVTTVPLLVFPALFEEKARTARFQAARQEHIRERSRTLPLAA